MISIWSIIMKRQVSRIVATALVVALTTSAWASVTYQCDGLHRLTHVMFDDGSAIVFEYDAVGNRTLRVMTSDPNTVYLATHVEPTGSGSVTRNPEMTWYPVGTPVELTATVDGFCTFTGWTGDVPPGHEQDNPLTVTLDSYKSVTANFDAPAGDAEPDCDVDLADFARFQRCFGESRVSGECAVFDLETDDDVDLDDYELWTQSLTGPAE